MIIRRFLNDDPETPYAPLWDFSIGTTFCANINVESLAKFLLSKEGEVKNLPISIDQEGNFTDGYTGLGKNSTTSRFQRYNVLQWDNPEVKKLKQNIIDGIIEYNRNCGNKNPDELYITCWYNILRFGQRITPHLHSSKSDCYLTGHFNVQVEDTSTVYMYPINQINEPKNIPIKNINGEFSLVPSYIIHYTTRHYSFKPRITIGFDLNTKCLASNWMRII